MNLIKILDYWRPTLYNIIVGDDASGRVKNKKVLQNSKIDSQQI